MDVDLRDNTKEKDLMKRAEDWWGGGGIGSLNGREGETTRRNTRWV